MTAPILLEHEAEEIRGIPGRLPEGERLLWQGAPAWWPLALRAYRVRALAIYFTALAALGFIAGLRDGLSATDAVYGLVPLILLAFTALGTVTLLAWLSARATVYSVTTRRVVIQGGAALPVSVNLPFSAVASAQVKLHGDGTGDIALGLAAPHRVSYLLMWPHVRPWRFSVPEPSLRTIRAPAEVAQLLSRALAAAAGMPTPAQPALDVAGQGARHPEPAVA
ncbi:photosynthetic complex putative assembly protein PuhB [Elioraea tepidiphila]|uniref:photosynthetic complex putative assembly protein PuhB n=1 Tax=Elioraea tepidiphila TaxID=457934 RepID=UPI00037328D3|nr:photosynthetic complex putative assembly protein PuhB [Elioraea tepidiphila]